MKQQRKTGEKREVAGQAATHPPTHTRACPYCEKQPAALHLLPKRRVRGSDEAPPWRRCDTRLLSRAAAREGSDSERKETAPGTSRCSRRPGCLACMHRLLLKRGASPLSPSAAHRLPQSRGALLGHLTPRKAGRPPAHGGAAEGQGAGEAAARPPCSLRRFPPIVAARAGCNILLPSPEKVPIDSAVSCGWNGYSRPRRRPPVAAPPATGACFSPPLSFTLCR